MPTEMTDQELETVSACATEVDTYELRNEFSEYDWIKATLYRTEDGRYYRVVDSDGNYVEIANGAHYVQWLTDDERERWTVF